ncbi:MAG: hypothetical protein HY332_11420 [Chloroflexi bacterium]|nr:hypothetical protein [Chloroflexota bacterium]
MWRSLGVAGCFTLLALVHTYPLVTRLATHMPYGLGDQVLLVTTLEWERWALLHAPRRFFDGFIFYGVDGVGFFNQLVFGGLPVYVPVATLTGNPVLAFNLAFITGMALTSWLAYRALLVATADHVASLAGGVLWSFALPQVGLYVMPEFAISWNFPLMLWAFLSFLRRPATWKLGVTTAALWLLLCTHIYIGFMAGAVLLILGLGAIASRTLPWPLLSWRMLRAAAVVVLVSLPFLPVPLGYLGVARRWSDARPVWLAQRYAAEPLDYLVPPPGSLWYERWLGEQFARPAEGHLPARMFPGIVPVVLGVVGLLWAIRGHGQRKLVQLVAATAGFAVLAGFVASLGPDLWWHDRPTGIALPYTWVYTVFPPIRSLRAVSRFVYLVAIGLAILSALGIVALRTGTAQRPRRQRWLVTGALALLVLEPLHAPIEVYAIDTLATSPPVIDLLKRSPRRPLVFAPVEAPSDPAWPDTRRMYWAVTTGPRHIVNGSSALYPSTYWDIQRLIDEAGPGDVPALVDVLRTDGLRHVALERPSMDSRLRERWACALVGSPGSTVLYDDGSTLVADLGPPSGPVQSGFAALDGQWLHTSVPAEAGMMALLRVSAKQPEQVWLQSQPAGAPFRTLTLSWRVRDASQDVLPRARLRRWLPHFLLDRLDARTTTATRLTLARRVVFPSFLRAGESAALTVHTFTPARPGEYTLSAEVDGESWASWPVRVGQADPVLTLPAAPGGLAARLYPLNVKRAVFAGEPVALDVVAQNTGRTLWDGQVRLGYRWSKIDESGGSSSIPELDGRIFLGRDTRPGTSYRFTGELQTPRDPGSYRLFVSMVAESLIWFDQMTPSGVAPLELDVTVHPQSDVMACR